MLSKLLKYELRASGRILLPVYALLLASAGCCSLFYKLAADHPYRTGAASVLMGLLMMAFYLRSGHRRHHGAADDLSVL